MSNVTLIEKIKELQAAGIPVIVLAFTGEVSVELEGAEVSEPVLTPEPAPEDPVPAPPPADPTTTYVRAIGKINARFASSINKADKPVLSIYPRDTASVDERIQFQDGEEIQVYLPLVDVDGGGKAYKLVNAAPDGTVLYVRYLDVSVVPLV